MLCVLRCWGWGSGLVQLDIVGQVVKPGGMDDRVDVPCRAGRDA